MFVAKMPMNKRDGRARVHDLDNGDITDVKVDPKLSIGVFLVMMV